MKKLAAKLIVAFTVGIFFPVVPQASAASVGDTIAQAVVEQNIAASRIQDLIKIKQDLKNGNKEGAVVTLAALAQNQISGKNDFSTVFAGGNIKQAVEAAVRQQVEQKINERLAPIQSQLNLLALILNRENKLTPNAVKDNSSLTGAPENYSRIINMTATAYGPGPMDNGKWGNLTYMGGIVKKGVAAVDPNVIPMGTKLWIEGYGFAIAEDQGSAIKGNRIDLAFNSRQEALDYGIQNVKVYVLN